MQFIFHPDCSEVDTDMLLVSDFLYFKYYVNKIWNQTLVSPYNIRVYITCLLDLCNINHVFATSVWF